MASRARVVLNLCGPYTLHGRPVIEACVANGAHYVDLTGEIPFVRQIIDDYETRAEQAGVKVVQVSGFEALPPDLATKSGTVTNAVYGFTSMLAKVLADEKPDQIAVAFDPFAFVDR